VEFLALVERYRQGAKKWQKSTGLLKDALAMALRIERR
jgi:hypothetical protein